MKLTIGVIPLRCSFRILFVLVPFGAVDAQEQVGIGDDSEQGVW